MAWWLWMMAGAASAALVLFVSVYVIDCIDSRAAARRRSVGMHQRAAERAIEQKVQETISEMFRAARGGGFR